MQEDVEDMDALVNKTGAHYVFGVSSGALNSLQAAHTGRIEFPELGHGGSGNTNRGGKPEKVAQELRRFFANRRIRIRSLHRILMKIETNLHRGRVLRRRDEERSF